MMRIDNLNSSSAWAPPGRSLAAAVVLALLLAACGGFHIGVPTRLADAPAPTTIPQQTANRVMLDEGVVELPPGFQIAVLASGLEGPRMLAVGPDGWLYVAERGADRIVRLPDRDGDGRADDIELVVAGLDNPSSLAFDPNGSLYVAETDRVLRYPLLTDDSLSGFEYGQGEVVVPDLPDGGVHSTRTLQFSPDGRWLFVSVGSSCNVCEEQDPRRAAVLRYSSDGTGEMIFSSGLRNAVGLARRPGSGEIWASNNGRDLLGDDLPPDTLHLLQEGVDYGWPRCSSGRIEDPDFGGEGSCEGVPPPKVELQAHSAPLGLTFYEGQAFPGVYQGDLFVAFHGSWNRSEPTGYKVVRVPMNGGMPGPVEDFATGWLNEDGTNWGRPVDVLSAPDGSLLISDDAHGRIYRIWYAGIP